MFCFGLFSTGELSSHFLAFCAPSSWLSALESTKWLQHLSVMLKAAVLVSSAVDREGRPVLVHCSDGWDRTPQIVALAKILLDPYYRTMEVGAVLRCWFVSVRRQLWSRGLRRKEQGRVWQWVWWRFRAAAVGVGFFHVLLVCLVSCTRLLCPAWRGTVVNNLLGSRFS